jgi:hypothetical protein
MKSVDTSPEKGSSTSGSGSAGHDEDLTLDLDVAFRATPEDCEALERNRPGGVSYEEYFRFLKQFRWTEEQLRAIPLSTGPRFTLD